MRSVAPRRKLRVGTCPRRWNGLTPDASSTAANTSLVLSLGGPGGGGPGYAVWTGYCGFANAVLAVATYDMDGALSNSVAFTAIVP